MTEKERSNIYWQLKDYEYFRGTAQIIASEVLKVTASQPPSSHSYNAVLTRAYDLCAILSETSSRSISVSSSVSGRSRSSGRNSSISSSSSRDTRDTSGGNEYSESSSSTSTSTATNKYQQEEHGTGPADEEATTTATATPEATAPGPILPPHLFAALTHWVKSGHSRRGLEKFCVTSHIRVRPMAKAATVQAVLLAQDLLRSQRSSSSGSSSESISTSQRSSSARSTSTRPRRFHIGNSEFPLDEDIPQDEILRLVSQRFSKTSRYYSTAIGHADAAAVGNFHYPIPAPVTASAAATAASATAAAPVSATIPNASGNGNGSRSGTNGAAPATI